MLRVGGDLAIKDGNGLSSLGSTGVGADLVLQWWVRCPPLQARSGPPRAAPS